MNEKEEQIYTNGENQSLKDIIRICQNKLRGNGVILKTKDEFDQERIETVKFLRDICSSQGDNDWDDDLHLIDVLRKHIDWNDV